MSDSNLTIQRQNLVLTDQLERLRKADVPPLYMPWSQRVINPFPLASSGVGWGDSVQPWAATVVMVNISVFVNTTNNGSNFWTLTLVDDTNTTRATVSTSAISAGAWARLSATPSTQPASTNTVLTVVATATGSPGAIYIVPSVALLRTGN